MGTITIIDPAGEITENCAYTNDSVWPLPIHGRRSSTNKLIRCPATPSNVSNPTLVSSEGPGLAKTNGSASPKRIGLVNSTPPPAIKKLRLLVMAPFALSILIGPVVAPEGTVTINCVFAAEVTVATVPLNLTVFDAGFASNPVP